MEQSKIIDTLETYQLAMDKRGDSPPIYGGGQGRIRRGSLSPSLPVVPECRRGKDRDDDLHQQSLLPSTPTLSSSMQWCNTPSPRRNLYLNMMLNAIYYFPMIYGYLMMFE